MTKLLEKLFSREGRKVMYALIAGVLGVALIFGWIDADSETLILDQVTKFIGIIGSVLALLNLTPKEGELHEVDPT